MTTMPRISALIFGLSLVGGCSRTSPDTASPDSREARDSLEDDNPSPTPTLSSNAALHSPTATGVHIDPTLATVCELSTDDDFFVFDDENSDVRADRLLEAVARCVTDGPLTGRRIELVTYATGADAKPRAHDRTKGLRGALLQGGMAEADVLTAAETGDAEMPQGAVGWPNERRVDIRIAPRRSH
jgi:hypothetical protein